MKSLRDHFLDIEHHPLNMYKNAFAKLKKCPKEFQFALDTIEHIKDMDKHDRMFTINRLFMDKDKSKNWTIIIDLLSTASIKRSLDE